MTRNDIAKSLKPIEWTYSHECSMYRTSFAFGGKSFVLEISPAFGAQGILLLMIRQSGVHLKGYKFGHYTLDSAMQEARNFLITEVCNLFELNEQ